MQNFGFETSRVWKWQLTVPGAHIVPFDRQQYLLALRSVILIGVRDSVKNSNIIHLTTSPSPVSGCGMWSDSISALAPIASLLKTGESDKVTKYFTVNEIDIVSVDFTSTYTFQVKVFDENFKEISVTGFCVFDVYKNNV